MLGAVIDKYFDGHGVFSGTVVAYHPRDPPTQLRNLYTVRYQDGDTEDCEWRELHSMFRPRPAKPCASAAGALRGKGDKNARKGASLGAGRGGMAELEGMGERELGKQRQCQQLVLLYLAVQISQKLDRCVMYSYTMTVKLTFGEILPVDGAAAAADLAVGILKSQLGTRVTYRSLLQNIVFFIGLFCKRDLSFSGAY